MGRYASFSSDVTNRFPRTLTDSRAVATLEAAYLTPAEAYIESRLAARFTVPFSSNNQTVKDLVIDRTLVNIGMFKEKNDDLSKSIDERIKALIDGTMVMVTTSGEVAAYNLSGVINTTAEYHPVFGMGPIEDMEVDDERTDDEENAR
jgi:hypothetical protein